MKHDGIADTFLGTKRMERALNNMRESFRYVPGDGDVPTTHC